MLIASARQDAERIESESRLGAGRPTGLAVDPFESAPPPGYRILAEIHRGAQGIVYRAEHERTRRQVAIKAILAAPLTALRDAERFEREVEALRRVDDPRVVSIHDCGVAAGCFFLVMDCVEGVPIDEYVRTHELSLRERVRLHAEICEAVHSAHVKGVIHRDIKPGNVLISADGRPHVLDFGLAKFLSEGSWDARATATRTGQFVGSLPWASPEQGEGLPDAVDLRSDVYSLGVVLFQLLTGRLPYDLPQGLRPALEMIAKVPARRPRDLCRAVDDEIETIVLKCLRKEPERRYQSAGELARDLRRYLAGEPIEAKRDKGWYMIRKIANRHRASVAVGLVLVLGTMMFGATAWYLGRQAAMARDRAMQAQHQALAERERAREAEQRAAAVADFLKQAITSADPDAQAAREVTVREVLERAAARTQDLGSGSGEDLVVRADIQQTLGHSFEELGLFDQAEELYWAAATTRLREAARGIDDEGVAGQLDSLEAESAPNDELVAQAGAVVETIQARREMTSGQAEAIAKGLAAISSAQRARRRLESAERAFQRAVKMADAGQPNDPVFALDARRKLAAVIGSLGRAEEGVALVEEALTKAKDNPLLGQGQVSVAYSTLGHLLQQAGRSDAARDAFNKAVEHAAPADDAFAAGRIAESNGSLWRVARKYQRAAEYLESAVSQFESVGESGWSPSAHARLELAQVYAEMGESEKASHLFEQVLAESRDRPGDSISKSAVPICQLASFRISEGRYKEAEELLVDGVRASHELNRAAAQNLRGSVRMLIQRYRAAGDAESAERCEALLEELP